MPFYQPTMVKNYQWRKSVRDFSHICIKWGNNKARYVDIWHHCLRWLGRDSLLWLQFNIVTNWIWRYGDMEIHVLGRRKFQYLAIISIRGAWEGAQMDTVFIRPPYLSGVFLWSAYLRNRQELVTCFKIAHYFLICHDNLCSGSIFWKRIVLSKGSNLNTIKSS